MNVIDVGSLIFFSGNGTSQSETFRVPDGRQFVAIVETTTVSVSGVGPKVVVTLQQSSDLVTWTALYLSGTTHELNAAPQQVRTAGTSTVADRVVQPYIRLNYDGSAGSTPQALLFSARITLAEARSNDLHRPAEIAHCGGHGDAPHEMR